MTSKKLLLIRVYLLIGLVSAVSFAQTPAIPASPSTLPSKTSAGTLPVTITRTSMLEAGSSAEAELKSGEAHAYVLQLASGQYAYVRTDQDGVDVIVRLVGPAGNELSTIDSPNGSHGEEPLRFVADVEGRYTIEIISSEPSARAGRYKITAVELRDATTDDRTFIEAARLESEAESLPGVPSTEELAAAAGKKEQAARMYRELKRPELEARALADAAEMLDPGPYYERAMSDLQRALEIFESLYSDKNVARVLTTLAGVSWAGSPDPYNVKAIEYFGRAIELKLSLGDKRGAAISLNDLGRLYSMQQEFDNALSTLERAQRIADEAGQKGIVTSALVNTANLYSRFGDLARAMEYRQRALAIAEAAKLRSSVGSNLMGIALIYAAQGNDAAAIEYSERALKELPATTGTAGNRLGAYRTIANIYLARGEYDRAMETFELGAAALAAAKVKDAYSQVDRGTVRFAQGRYDEAASFFQKGLDEFGGRHPRASLWLAKTYEAKGELQRALELTDQLLKEPLISVSRNTVDLYTTAGRLELSTGRFTEAERDLKRAVSMVEDMLERVAGAETDQAQFMERAVSPYVLLAKLLVSQKRTAEAFEVVERSKSRALLDALRTGKQDALAKLDPALKERERTLSSELAFLNSALQKTPEAEKEKVTDLEFRRNKKRLEIEDFRTQLYAAYPSLKARSVAMEPLSIDEAAKLVRDERSVHLEYLVFNDRTLLFVFDKAAGVQGPSVYQIELDKKKLEAQVAQLTKMMAEGDPGFSSDARALYGLLLKPIQNRLAGKTELVVVPDGPLWNLPFQALMDESGRYLAEKMAVSYAPSLTALSEMKKKAKERKRSKDAELVAFGNPTVNKETADRVGKVFMDEKLEPLPEAERLVNTLAKMYGPQRSKVYTGAAAKEEMAKLEAPKFRIVQFATHGILNDVSPMYSHLVLAQDEKNPNEDGLLEAWELKDLDLKADMVILSACDTARGKISSGEGIIGMTWAAFIAGAPTTVASQWKVESTSTTELMLEFHRQLLSGKVSKAEALRRAQLKLMRNPKYKHPSYWAAWVIVGDGS